MADSWLVRLKIIAGTAAVTSLAWIGFGGWWWMTSNDAETGRTQVARVENTAAMAPGSDRPGQPLTANMVATAVTDRPSSLLIPVQGITRRELTDNFTQPRSDGTLGGVRVHNAIDIMAPLGRPVIAAASGRVAKLFQSEVGGNTIYIRTPDGTSLHYYAHLDSYAPDLREDAFVAAGQVIGTVGHSGNADPAGPHLHFEVMRLPADAPWYSAKTQVNPYPLLTGGSDRPKE